MGTMMDHVNYMRQGLLDMDEHDEQDDLLQHVRALWELVCVQMFNYTDHM